MGHPLFLLRSMMNYRTVGIPSYKKYVFGQCDSEFPGWFILLTVPYRDWNTRLVPEPVKSPGTVPVG